MMVFLVSKQAKDKHRANEHMHAYDGDGQREESIYTVLDLIAFHENKKSTQFLLYDVIHDAVSLHLMY